jgi:hypothetical protein
MENTKNFKVRKRGKYFEIEYLKYNPSNTTIKVYTSRTILHSTKQDAKKFMTYILTIEPIMEKIMRQIGVSFDARKLISMRLDFIDNCVLGIEARSGFGIHKHAELIVDFYKKKYDEALTNGQEILKSIKDNPVEYMSNWKVFDDYKFKNELYELGLEPLEAYYAESSLDKAIKSADEALEWFKKNERNG